MAFVRQERNVDATLFVGELADEVTEELLWELMLQAGPVSRVHLPKDKLSGAHQGYGFVEFATAEDADYALRVLNMVKLFGRSIRLNRSAAHQDARDVGANLYIGNLDPIAVDDKLLHDTFGAFGVIIKPPKVMMDPETGESRGFGFISYDSFEAADRAILAMNGQYLCNRPIQVAYAYKKDGMGERHGSEAERILAAKSRPSAILQPHTMFASGPGQNAATPATSGTSAATENGTTPATGAVPMHPASMLAPGQFPGAGVGLPGPFPNMPPGAMPPHMQQHFQQMHQMHQHMQQQQQQQHHPQQAQRLPPHMQHRGMPPMPPGMHHPGMAPMPPGMHHPGMPPMPPGMHHPGMHPHGAPGFPPIFPPPNMRPPRQ